MSACTCEVTPVGEKCKLKHSTACPLFAQYRACKLCGWCIYLSMSFEPPPAQFDPFVPIEITKFDQRWLNSYTKKKREERDH